MSTTKPKNHKQLEAQTPARKFIYEGQAYSQKVLHDRFNLSRAEILALPVAAKHGSIKLNRANIRFYKLDRRKIANEQKVKAQAQAAAEKAKATSDNSASQDVSELADSE